MCFTELLSPSHVNRNTSPGLRAAMAISPAFLFFSFRSERTLVRANRNPNVCINLKKFVYGIFLEEPQRSSRLTLQNLFRHMGFLLKTL